MEDISKWTFPLTFQLKPKPSQREREREREYDMDGKALSPPLLASSLPFSYSLSSSPLCLHLSLSSLLLFSSLCPRCITIITRLLNGSLSRGTRRNSNRWLLFERERIGKWRESSSNGLHLQRFFSSFFSFPGFLILLWFWWALDPRQRARQETDKAKPSGRSTLKVMADAVTGCKRMTD